jgi:hypothetical protein
MTQRERRLKALLDEKVLLYNRPAFIEKDPVSIPHLFVQRQDIEIAGLFAAVLAWGNRTSIINNCRRLLGWMDNRPYEFVLHHEDSDLRPFLQFAHRTFNATDLLYFLHFLQYHYRRFDSLEDAFLPGVPLQGDAGSGQLLCNRDAGDSIGNSTSRGAAKHRRGTGLQRTRPPIEQPAGATGRGSEFAGPGPGQATESTAGEASAVRSGGGRSVRFAPADLKKYSGDSVEQALISFHNYFFSLEHPERTRKHIATPARKSACKRLNMYLRWMVRNDGQGVDFGLWRRFAPSQLVCPLDVHVARVAHRLGLIPDGRSNWSNALTLTARLRAFRPEDPAIYDYALFGLGAEERLGR